MSSRASGRVVAGRPRMALVGLPSPDGPGGDDAPSGPWQALGQALATVLADGGDISAGVIEALEETVADEVRCGVQLPELLAQLTAVQGVAWSARLQALQHQHGASGGCAGAVADDSVRLLALVDEVRRAVAERYIAERDAWTRSAEAARGDLLRRILAGEAVDVGAAAEQLGYDLGGRHLAILVWAADPVGGMAAIRPACLQAARRLGDGASAVALDLELGVCLAWARLRPGPRCAPDALDAHLPAGLAAAVGAPREGVDGFRRTATDARFARRIAQLQGPLCGRVARFGDVALLALLSSDLDEAARFTGDVLGPLAGAAAATRRIADTLRVYFEEGGSPVRAARRLGVHQNTVVYRLHRAADLLGHAIDERGLEVWTALRLDELLRARDAGAA